MIKFGTGGWREIIGENFTKENVRKIAFAMTKIIKEEQAKETIVIGYDRRFLSKEAAIWASEIFASQNIKVLFINKSQPTPLIMYAIMKLELDYGLAITASHNPALYNGVKVFTKGGRDANEVATKKVQDVANEVNDTLDTLTFDEYISDGMIEYLDYFNEYIDGILLQTDIDAIKNARLKVVLDPMYGVSQTSLRTILSTARCDLTVINERHDTLFGGKLPTPNAEGLYRLKQTVLEGNYDFGIATDGDADRIGIIDHEGNFIHPNAILVLLYYYLLEYKGWSGDVVRNNSTTHLLDVIAEKFGYQCHEVNVGFKHISSKMEESKAIIGGESSGGLTVEGHINGKDGIYAAAILVEMVACTGKSMKDLYTEITDQFGFLHYVDTDYSFSFTKKKELLDTLMIERSLPTFDKKIEKVSYQDGCKVYFSDGSWIIARFSGTEPLLRMACEMKCEVEAKATISKMEEFLGLI